MATNKAFDISQLSLQRLQQLKLDASTPLNQATISQVHYKPLTKHVDARGDLTELWSQPWSQQEPVAQAVKHVYSNTTHHLVIKAWHVHEYTFSQYTCIHGKLQVVLVDVRPDSNTYGQVNQFLIGQHNPALIKIPPGVLKGWRSIQSDSIIVNLLTSADIEDNHKYPWDSILSDIWLPHYG